MVWKRWRTKLETMSIVRPAKGTKASKIRKHLRVFENPRMILPRWSKKSGGESEMGSWSSTNLSACLDEVSSWEGFQSYGKLSGLDKGFENLWNPTPCSSIGRPSSSSHIGWGCVEPRAWGSVYKILGDMMPMVRSSFESYNSLGSGLRNWWEECDALNGCGVCSSLRA